MKTVRYFIVSVVCSFLAVSCSQKTVTVPASSGSSRITEQSLQGPSAGQESASAPSPLPATQEVILPHQGGGAPDSASANPDSLSLGFINGRIIDYEQKLGRWQELDNQSTIVNINAEQTETMLRCYREIQAVLSGYQRMRDEKLQSYTPAANAAGNENMETLRLDIAFLEGTCGALLGSGVTVVSGWGPGQGAMELDQIQVLIEQSAVNEDHEEVIDLWAQIPADQIDKTDASTRIHYAKALMLGNQAGQAAGIYQQLVEDLSSPDNVSMDLLSLRKTLGDLYTAAGDFSAAEEQYTRISTEYLDLGKIEEWTRQQLFLMQRSITDNPELSDYSALLRGYLGFLPERDGFKVVWQAESFLQQYPYSPVSANVDIIKERVQTLADRWFSAYREKIDAYLAEKNYQEAIILIQGLSPDIVSQEDLLAIQEKGEAIVLAEAVEREAMKREALQDLLRRWNEGMRLAEENDIDGALVIFNGLLDTEYGPRAEKKINELSLETAKSERRKAADYFIRFTKAPDVQTKKEMLIESRRILKDILRKYPDVEISDKVSGNILRVEKEMNEIDPLLLVQIEQEERQQELLEKQLPEAQGPGEEVDVFDLPLSAAPGAIRSSEPLPVILPQDLQ